MRKFIKKIVALFQKDLEQDFVYQSSPTNFEVGMIDMRAEIKALKRYLPLENVEQLEKRFCHIIKWSNDQARKQGIDYGRKTPNSISHPYFESDSYHYPNCIFEKL